MLGVQDLSLTRGERFLVEGVSLRVPSHTVLHVRGANGRGKTTLLRALCGLALPESGEVTWHGEAIRGATKDRYHDDMLFLGHRPALKPALTPAENLGHYQAFRSQARGGVEQALEAMGLTSVSTHPCATLSAGQLRRTSLARLLSERASLWILDEPFVALDAEGEATLAGLIHEHVRDGGAAVITSHQTLPPPIDDVSVLDLDERQPAQ